LKQSCTWKIIYKVFFSLIANSRCPPIGQ
jgi:hypothetical protein